MTSGSIYFDGIQQITSMPQATKAQIKRSCASAEDGSSPSTSVPAPPSKPKPKPIGGPGKHIDHDGAIWPDLKYYPPSSIKLELLLVALLVLFGLAAFLYLGWQLSANRPLTVEEAAYIESSATYYDMREGRP